jgi:hypothetical protein
MTEEDVSYLSMIMQVSSDKDDIIEFLKKMLRKNEDKDQKDESENNNDSDKKKNEDEKLRTGKEFNSLFSQHKFYKILHETLNHNGFQYKEGLNIDSEEFCPHGECEKGGLYFAMEEHILLYTEYGSKIATVHIPDDAMVYIEKEKFKSNKIILSDIISLVQYPPFMKKCIETIRQDGSLECVISPDSVLTAQNFPEKLKKYFTDGRELIFRIDRTDCRMKIAITDDPKHMTIFPTSILIISPVSDKKTSSCYFPNTYGLGLGGRSGMPSFRELFFYALGLSGKEDNVMTSFFDRLPDIVSSINRTEGNTKHEIVEISLKQNLNTIEIYKAMFSWNQDRSDRDKKELIGTL